MFSRHRERAKVLFGVSDILITVLAFEAAYLSRLWLPLENVFFLIPPVKTLLLGFSALAWVAFGLWLKVYDKLDAGNPRVIVRDSFRQSAAGVLALVLVAYLLRLDSPLSRSFLAFFAGYSFLLLSLVRLGAGKVAGAIVREPHYVMVVGVGESALKLGAALEDAKRYGVRLLGFVAENPAAAPGRIQLRASYEVYPIGELPKLLRRQVIDEVLFTVDGRGLTGLEDLMVLCDEEGVRTRVMVDFFPHVNSQLYLERLGTIPLLTFSAAPHDEIRLLAKRCVDVVLAAAALVVLTPFLLLVMVLVRLTSPGPAIFRQIRCGLNGRRFTCYKFRSMCENAEEMRASLEHLSTKSTAFKIPNDPRLTRVGRFLRKFSIDEWPQLWNVLKGDMSLVGPRPAVPVEVDQYKGWQRRRLRMRPGLTCLWALAGRDHLDFDTWMKMDMLYIDNWSLGLDCKILLRTIPRVIIGRGAY